MSIGFAVFPLDPEAPRAWDWDATLRLADAALYAAKAQGRDGYVGALRADGLQPDGLDLDGETWTQKPQKYHARSLAMLRAKYAAAADKAELDPVLQEAGCLQGLHT